MNDDLTSEIRTATPEQMERVKAWSGLPKPAPRVRATICPKCGATKPSGRGCGACRWTPDVKTLVGPNPISEKRQKQTARYPEFRKGIIARDRGCVACIAGIPWCPGDGPLEVDHIDGRRGDHLLDERNVVTLHRAGHVYKTEHSKETKPILRAYIAGLYGQPSKEKP